MSVKKNDWRENGKKICTSTENIENISKNMRINSPNMNENKTKTNSKGKANKRINNKKKNRKEFIGR